MPMTRKNVLPPSACTTDHIEVIRRQEIHIRVRPLLQSMHNFRENEELRKASNSAAIYFNSQLQHIPGRCSSRRREGRSLER
jgi:hypothetical protein